MPGAVGSPPWQERCESGKSEGMLGLIYNSRHPGIKRCYEYEWGKVNIVLAICAVMDLDKKV